MEELKQQLQAARQQAEEARSAQQAAEKAAAELQGRQEGDVQALVQHHAEEVGHMHGQARANKPRLSVGRRAHPPMLPGCVQAACWQREARPSAPRTCLLLMRISGDPFSWGCRWPRCGSSCRSSATPRTQHASGQRRPRSRRWRRWCVCQRRRAAVRAPTVELRSSQRQARGRAGLLAAMAVDSVERVLHRQPL